MLGAAQLGQFGGMQEELETLKRDKNVLMLELVRLRQQQQVGVALCHLTPAIRLAGSYLSL